MSQGSYHSTAFITLMPSKPTSKYYDKAHEKKKRGGRRLRVSKVTTLKRYIGNSSAVSFIKSFQLHFFNDKFTDIFIIHSDLKSFIPDSKCFCPNQAICVRYQVLVAMLA